MKRYLLIVFLFSAVWIGQWPLSPVHAQERNAELEYKLKVAFLLNFAKFIHWPDSAFADNDQLFHLCVFGEIPFASALSVLESRSVNNRKIALHQISKVQQAEKCQLLFISSSESEIIKNTGTLFDNYQLATVSDSKGFCEVGGTIEFVPLYNKLTISINLAEAQEHELEIDSGLLSLVWKVIK